MHDVYEICKKLLKIKLNVTKLLIYCAYHSEKRIVFRRKWSIVVHIIDLIICNDIIRLESVWYNNHYLVLIYIFQPHCMFIFGWFTLFRYPYASWLFMEHPHDYTRNRAVTLKDVHGPLARYAKLRVRMRRECRERFPRHRGWVIPTCITARASRTCRDACRDR